MIAYPYNYCDQFGDNNVQKTVIQSQDLKWYHKAFKKNHNQSQNVIKSETKVF